MTLRAYKEINFTPDRRKLISQINGMVENYAKQGMLLTVRQIYYQFVTLNIVPNSLESYNKVQSAINDGRLAGLISWTAIEDRNRELLGHETFISPKQALNKAAIEYKRDLWEDQPMRVEVWVEKAALLGVIGSICAKLRVDYFTQRGYNSSSEQWRAGQRFASYIRKGQRVIVFHLGDHDPSGLDMTRDNREKLELFSGVPVMVQRLALNMDQVEQYNPPPNPAKSTDSRYAGYKRDFGDSSWELDALEPSVIQALIKDAVDKVRDPAKWNANLLREEQEIRQLKEAVL